MTKHDGGGIKKEKREKNEEWRKFLKMDVQRGYGWSWG